MPLFYCYRGVVRRHRELRILKDEFNPSEIPLLELRIPLLIDPLDDRPEQIVFVAIQRPDFTHYHLILLSAARQGTLFNRLTRSLMISQRPRLQYR